jgi:phage head maturation protease
MWQLQLGESTLLEEDDRGFYFEAAVAATRESADVLSVIQHRGRMDASISFDYGETEEDDEGVTTIYSFSKLYEVSPVTWGANPAAYVELMPLSEAGQERSAPPISATAFQNALLAAALRRATANIQESEQWQSLPLRAVA